MLNVDSNRYYFAGAGVYLPKASLIKDSSSRTLQVSPYLGAPVSLEQYVRAQLLQSRYKYFVFGEIYKRDPWVHACINYIAARITREPNRLVDKTDPLNPDVLDIQNFFDEVNPDGMDFQDLYYGWVQDIYKYGAAYSYIERNNKGDKVVNLWPMEAKITFPVTDTHGTTLFYAQVYNGTAEFYEPEEVLYLGLRNNGASPIPISPLEPLCDTVAMDLNANKYNQALFENHLNIGAIFSMVGATEEEVLDNIRYLEDKYSKPENAHRHLVLRGDARLVRDGVQAQKDLHFDTMFMVNRRRVCAVLGVPEALLGVPESANRSTTDTLERNAYVATIRPMRRYINRRITSGLIRPYYSKSVILEEPLNAMLPTKTEIDAVSEVANIGAKFNDLQAMLGLDEIPNGDYYVMKGGGNAGFVRLDTLMPGLGDRTFDPVSWQLEQQAHEQQQQQAQMDASAQGMQPPQPTSAFGQYGPVRPQDRIVNEPVGARIIDISRSLRGERGYGVTGSDWYGISLMVRGEEVAVVAQEIARRTPNSPGQRGGNVYFTKTGRPRYGAPPKGTNRQPPVTNKAGQQNQNTLTNPRDADLPKTLTPQQRQAVNAARIQVSVMLRQAQDENWTNDEFFNRLDKSGWQRASGAADFQDVRDAKADARRLGGLYPDSAFVIVGSDGQYQVFQKDLTDVGQQEIADKGKDVGNQAAPNASQPGVVPHKSADRPAQGENRPQGSRPEGNVGGSAERKPGVARSMSAGSDLFTAWAEKVNQFARRS